MAQLFGTLPDGTPVHRYPLANANGIEAEVITYGGILRTLRVPDRDGRSADVVLGHDVLAPYLRLETSPFFGALIGRFANRIAGAAFRLDGETHRLPANDGPNTLHGGPEGFHTVVWDAAPFEGDGRRGVTLMHTSPDGHMGFPGTLAAEVTYTLTDDDTLVLDYAARTDRATPVSLTNHTYFNLAGAGAETVLGHELTLAAARYAPIDDGGIPEGPLRAVAGTPFDFTTSAPLGARIDADDAQLRHGDGYDHPYALDGDDGALREVARLREPASGRTLRVATTLPSLQLYTGNQIRSPITGKDDAVYRRRSGVCLETQAFPDAPNQPRFPSAILRPGDVYRARTVWAFGVEA